MKIKIAKKNYLVKFLTGSLVILNLISCNPNQPQPQPTAAPAPAPAPQPSSVLVKWSLIIDGQSHSWQGDYPSQSGDASSMYVIQPSGESQIFCNKNLNSSAITISISKLGMTATGSYTINQANYHANNSLFSVSDMNNNKLLSNFNGGSVTVNITTFPSNSVQANNNSVSGITNNVKVIGTFSGTLGNAITGGTSTISGSFEAVRIN